MKRKHQGKTKVVEKIAIIEEIPRQMSKKDLAFFFKKITSKVPDGSVYTHGHFYLIAKIRTTYV